MNPIDSSSITDTMRAIWSMDLAKKYSHLLWLLLNQPLEVDALTAANVVLTAPMGFTIGATPFDKLVLEGQPLSPAVDAICCAVKQASPIPQPMPAVAALLPMMTMSVQMLSAIVHQPSSTLATSSPTVAANTFGEMLHPVNDDVSIIQASPSPSATAPQSLKIEVLRKIQPCGGLVLDLPSEEPILSDSDDDEE
uniref:Uncharacterized protein n=1 Tax=Romanomermis culicivorax TaxID=13658 RepID=A0A915JEA3_ROMCU